MKSALSAVLFIFCLQATAQSVTCNCDSSFLFVKEYMQQNHAAFSDNVTPERKPAYERFCDSLLNAIQQDNCHTDCHLFISRYLKFFRDQHISIGLSAITVNENDSADLQRFKSSAVYKKRERYVFTEEELNTLRQKPLLDIEGIYYTLPDSSYGVALVKKEKGYKAVIISSRSKLWDRYLVKFELTPINDSTFLADRYMRDFSHQQATTKFINGSFPELSFYKKLPATTASNPTSPFSFRKISDSTNYLNITSFDGRLSKNLNEFYTTIDSAIKATPYLIIDVRNNGGGSDESYRALVQYFYTNPIAGDIVELYATPGNIRVYEDQIALMKKDEKNYGAANIFSMQRNLDKMKKAVPYTFVPMGNGKTEYKKLSGKLFNPQKVVILYNRGCASSCESLLFDAIQSKKVITMGENSGGFTGYGNVFPVPVPNSNLVLYCTTTRYRNQRVYDGIGIPPMVSLPAKEDWVKAAAAILEKK